MLRSKALCVSVLISRGTVADCCDSSRNQRRHTLQAFLALLWDARIVSDSTFTTMHGFLLLYLQLLLLLLPPSVEFF